jgi:ribosome biogenesis GTPase
MRGIVIKSTGSWYRVKTVEEGIVECRLQGKFRTKGIKSTNPVAVGDEVDLTAVDDTYAITKIIPRKNYLTRKSTNLSKQVQIIAANIDQVLLVTSVVQPKVPRGLIDRVLVTAEAFDIPVIIVFNKFDLCDENDIDELAGRMATYDPIGYKCVVTSVKTERGQKELKELLTGKRTLLTGQSGVGKSSLINSIEPELDLRVGSVSDFNEKGQHTTTFAEMNDLSFGGEIIDTPGVRSFGFFDFDKEHLSHYFPEMRALLSECKFHNCVHINEPGCAVKDAVEKGEISSYRYQSYLNFYHDEDLTKTYD